MIKSMVQRSEVVSFTPPLTFTHEVERKALCGVDVPYSAVEHASIDIVMSRKHALSAAPWVFLGELLKKVRRD